MLGMSRETIRLICLMAATCSSAAANIGSSVIGEAEGTAEDVECVRRNSFEQKVKKQEHFFPGERKPRRGTRKRKWPFTVRQADAKR
mmetsp:Transcript_24443/g.43893  ORF Transcript_24443/g.43893 Transcript_24443/m.43893 type:complete len:87 (-) Transcript_24443:355-615(-)